MCIFEGDFEICPKFNVQMCTMHGEREYIKNPRRMVYRVV